MAATVHAEIEALRAELGLAPAVEAGPHGGEHNDSGESFDGAELERTSSGSLIATAHALIRESKDGLADLIDERIKESVSHTYKEVSAWSPRAGQAYAALQEQEAEFDAEGDAFVESLKEPEIAPELSHDAEMKAAYAEWEQQNAEFQRDGDNFAQSDSPRRRRPAAVVRAEIEALRIELGFTDDYIDGAVAGPVSPSEISAGFDSLPIPAPSGRYGLGEGDEDNDLNHEDYNTDSDENSQEQAMGGAEREDPLLTHVVDERIKPQVLKTHRLVSTWSPRAGQAYAALQEQEAEFDAEGDAFVESLKEPEIAPELSRDAEMKAAYAEWEQQNAEFQRDGDNFAQSDSPRRRAATGYNGGHSNDRPANGTYAQANHQEPASARVLLPDCSEAEKLASLQKEIAQLRASLGLLAD